MAHKGYFLHDGTIVRTLTLDQFRKVAIGLAKELEEAEIADKLKKVKEQRLQKGKGRTE